MSSNFPNCRVPYYAACESGDATTTRSTHLLNRKRNVQATIGYFGILKGLDARHAAGKYKQVAQEGKVHPTKQVGSVSPELPGRALRLRTGSIG